MADSKLRDLSIDFAVKVIKMCDKIKGHYSLVNQLERSSTSIGANIH
jgi:four helix bundle protein